MDAMLGITNDLAEAEGWISQKPNLIIVLLYIEGNKKKSCFCFFADSKQDKASELDMITLRNHAPRSYMT